MSFRKEDSNQLLVDRWVTDDDFVPYFSTLKRWGMHSWKLRGDLSVSKLVRGVILFDFEDTNDQLKRREMTFANRCFLCQEKEEAIDHLLLRCAKARVL